MGLIDVNKVNEIEVWFLKEESVTAFDCIDDCDKLDSSGSAIMLYLKGVHDMAEKLREVIKDGSD